MVREIRGLRLPFNTKARAWAKARPGQALLLAFGPARRFVKPKPDEARPKPGLSSQAGASKSLLSMPRRHVQHHFHRHHLPTSHHYHHRRIQQEWRWIRRGEGGCSLKTPRHFLPRRNTLQTLQHGDKSRKRELLHISSKVCSISSKFTITYSNTGHISTTTSGSPGPGQDHVSRVPTHPSP